MNQSKSQSTSEEADFASSFPLQFDAERMRRLGYRAVDLLVEHFESLPSQPVSRCATPQELKNDFDEPIPESPLDPQELLNTAQTSIFTRVMRPNHPRFFAFVPSPSNFLGAVAAMLAAGHNAFCGNWLEGAAAAQIELTVLDWLRQLCGMPETAGGLFTSGGSMANMTALAAARQSHSEEDAHKTAVYYSDQTHSSVPRALRVLGFRPEQLRQINSDFEFRIDIAALKDQINADRRAGLRPMCIVANAGATNTGAVDPLPALADLAKAQKLWLHVDAAFGGPAVLCPEGRKLLDGIGRADSITLDPHKRLFQPYASGCLLVRDVSALEKTFRETPEYLRDAQFDAGQVNFYDRGIELTRPFRAFGVWLTFKAFGRRALAAAIERGLELARLAERELRVRPHWRITTPAQLGIVTFQHVDAAANGDDNEFYQRLVQACIDDQTLMISTTRLRGQPVCRICTINPRTTDDDIRMSIDKIDELAARIRAG